MLYAPGREILTLLPGGHYDFASGASIATAQVSGVVALMLAQESRPVGGFGVSPVARHQFLAARAADGGVKGVDACAAVVTLAGQGTCHTSEGSSTAADESGNRVALH